MADPKQPPPGPFDVGTVRELIELMKSFDLSEVDLNDGDKRNRLRRGAKVVAAPASMVAPIVQQVPVAGPSPTASSTPAAPTRKLFEIKSELVGTFYAKPAPDKDDYVKVGAKVTADTVVCKVEAMKIFNDITAKLAGTVAEVCVKNGDFVEFDQVLFRVEPS